MLIYEFNLKYLKCGLKKSLDYFLDLAKVNYGTVIVFVYISSNTLRYILTNTLI